MKCLIHAFVLTFGLLSTAWAQSAKPMSTRATRGL